MDSQVSSLLVIEQNAGYIQWRSKNLKPIDTHSQSICDALPMVAIMKLKLINSSDTARVMAALPLRVQILYCLSAFSLEKLNPERLLPEYS